MARSESLVLLSLVIIFGAASVSVSSTPVTSTTLGIVGAAGFRLVAIFLAAILSFFIFSNRERIWNFLEKERRIDKRLIGLFLTWVLFALLLSPFYRRLPASKELLPGEADSSSLPLGDSISGSGEAEATAQAGQVLKAIAEVPEQAVSYGLLLPVLVLASLMALWLWRRRNAPSYLARRRDILELARASLDEAVTRLERYDNVRQTILACYKRMCSSLAGHGYSILPHHTAKEFEWIVGSALPLPKEALNRLTHLFEEARYSEHSLGEQSRQEAINSLRAIQSSLPLEYSK